MSYYRPSAYAFASLTAPAETTVVTAETYEYIRGTFANSPVLGFTGIASPDPKIQYTSAKTRGFLITWSATFHADENGTTVKFAIRKNADVITASVMSMYCKYAEEGYSSSGSLVVMLARNDTIQLVLTSDGNDDVISVDNFTTTINPIT